MAIYLVVLISTISQMGFGGSRVAVSLYALELGANQFTVGVIVALYSLSPMFFSIVIGRVSDRVSPHWPMIIGSVMMMVALLIPVASPSLVMLCVLAFLNGLGHLIFSMPNARLMAIFSTKETKMSIARRIATAAIGLTLGLAASTSVLAQSKGLDEPFREG